METLNFPWNKQRSEEVYILSVHSMHVLKYSCYGYIEDLVNVILLKLIISVLEQ